MSQDLAHTTPAWKSTGNSKFPLAAEVNGGWWVLRMNPFPDHSLWTLFIDGTARYDLDNTPPSWGTLPAAATPDFDSGTVARILAPVRNFEIYGSEVGRPCDGLFCCDRIE